MKGRRKFEFLARLQNNQKVRYSDIPNRATPDCRQCAPLNIGLIYIQWQRGSNKWMIFGDHWNQFSGKYCGQKKGGFTCYRFFRFFFPLELLITVVTFITLITGKGAVFTPKQCFTPEHELTSFSFLHTNITVSSELVNIAVSSALI